MTRQDADDYSKKHAPGQGPEQGLAGAIREAAEEGKITCSAVFRIASELNVSPQEAGKAVDLLKMKLVKCQLGLFGYLPEGRVVKPAEKVSPEMASAIRSGCVHGDLPCSRAWEVAEELNVTRMKVSSAAEALGIKIKPCQLGAF